MPLYYTRIPRPMRIYVSVKNRNIVYTRHLAVNSFVIARAQSVYDKRALAVMWNCVWQETGNGSKNVRCVVNRHFRRLLSQSTRVQLLPIIVLEKSTPIISAIT